MFLGWNLILNHDCKIKKYFEQYLVKTFFFEKIEKKFYIKQNYQNFIFLFSDLISPQLDL
jgi:hypothetical protein